MMDVKDFVVKSVSQPASNRFRERIGSFAAASPERVQSFFLYW
jgi:hypothetical protein